MYNFVILLLQLEKAYATASKNLLQLLIADNDLIGHLKSVKHYFLLDQGELKGFKLTSLFLSLYKLFHLCHAIGKDTI